MAPDINTLPTHHQPETSTLQASSSSSSRRASQIMGPPTVPASAVTSGQNIRSPTSSHFDAAAGVPLRHPRPLTAAELYLECEKEQEAVVNRLTRELTALRAQCASVASNASHSSVSTSASLLPVDITDPNPTHQMTGATHPTPSRRHRSSSSLSIRSNAQAQTASSGPAHPTQAPNTSTAGHVVPQASIDRAAAVVGGSRQPSASPSEASTSARQSLDASRQSGFPGALHILPHRPALSRDHSYASQAAGSTTAHAGSPATYQAPSPVPSPGFHMSATAAGAEPTMYRNEVEALRAENEALRQRVRTLERAVRSRRRDSSQSDAARPIDLPLRSPRDHGPMHDPSRSSITTSSGLAAWAAGDGGVGGVAGRRERSESQSTTASSRRAVGVVEDELKVGESAGSAGVARP